MQTSTGLLDQARNSTNDTAWSRLVSLYSPYLFGSLRRRGVQSHDADDLVQEVFRVVSVELHTFQHSRRVGAFRCWLRKILANRLRDHRRTAHRSKGRADSDLLNALSDSLEDDRSELAAIWDREHDEFVARRMLSVIEVDFQPTTWRAFWLVAVDGREPDVVAGELNLSVESVYTAKSRVLRRLRECTEEFLGR